MRKEMNEDYKNSIVTPKYLADNPDHIFVFGDNTVRRGKGGAAKLRDYPNTYGFITKLYPNNRDASFYKPEEYKSVFKNEITKLQFEIVNNPDKTYLISKLGAGLANKYYIFETIIEPGLQVLKQYNNVKFLWGALTL
jgi:hypothetical protein